MIVLFIITLLLLLYLTFAFGVTIGHRLGVRQTLAIVMKETITVFRNLELHGTQISSLSDADLLLKIASHMELKNASK